MTSDLGLDRVLVPVDLGPGSEVLFVHALKLALATGASLAAVHIADDPDQAVDWTAMPGALELLVRWGVLPENAAADDVARLGLHIDREARSADTVAHGLAGAVVHELPNVLVVGTEGRTGLERLRHGSVAEAVARRSGAVTLFVPEGADGFVDPATGRASVGRVLFPVGGDHDELQHAADILVAFLDVIDVRAGEIVLVHLPDGSGAVIDAPPDGRFTYTIDLRFGDVVEEIAAAMGEHEPDLVVMATRGHDSLMDSLRGSKTEQVLRRATCPVLAVPVG